MPTFLNSSAYLFVPFSPDELLSYRQKLHEFAYSFGENLRGTILISAEGFNLRLSGTHQAVKSMQQYLRDLDPRLVDFQFKDSVSDRITLPVMLVKIKREAIAMGVAEIQPAVDGSAPAISAEEFKAWMDKDKDMLVLDTRNDYEVRLGTFKRAQHLDIKSFRAFPSAAIEKLSNEPKDRPVVMFCTGGIRCEKASYCLQREGFSNVYQLDGGILRYFEKCGGEHYDGDCYIFDNRIALTPELDPANVTMCFKCRSPLTQKELELDSYVENQTCCYCIDGKTDFRSVN